MKHVDIPIALCVFAIIFTGIVVVVIIRNGVNTVKYKDEDLYKDSERPFIDKNQ